MASGSSKGGKKSSSRAGKGRASKAAQRARTFKFNKGRGISNSSPF